MDVKLGRYYRCIRTVYMCNHKDDIRYIEGKIYKSEIEGCITDETGLKDHIWTEGSKILEGTFTLVSNKRKRNGNNRDNRP